MSPRQVQTTPTTSSPYLILPPRVTPPSGGVAPPSGDRGVSGPSLEFRNKAPASSNQSEILSGLKFTPAPVNQVVKTSRPRSDKESSPVDLDNSPSRDATYNNRTRVSKSSMQCWLLVHSK